MDVPELLAAMAMRIATAPGIATAYYPAPNTIESNQTPAVVLYWGSDEDTTIDHRSGTHQLWLPSVRAQVLVPRKGDTPREFSKVDSVLTGIVDVLVGLPNTIMPGLTGHVDRVLVTRLRPTLQVVYAGSEYYAAEVFFSVKFHRNAEIA